MLGAMEPTKTDWTDCPLVEVIPGKVSGAPLLKGTRMPVDIVVENYQDGLPAEEIAEVFDLPEESVRALLDFALTHNASLRA
jgi:uncharacterized protein (DUF433 family)